MRKGLLKLALRVSNSNETWVVVQFEFPQASIRLRLEPGLLLGLALSLYHMPIATLGSGYSFPPTLTILVVYLTDYSLSIG